MENGKRIDRLQPILVRVFRWLVVFACLGTFASLTFHIEPGPIKPVIAISIILVGATVAALAIGDLVSVLSILVISSAAEIIGLFTGLPFGVYEYTDQWFPTIELGTHRFPLLLPLAWLMIISGCYRVAVKANTWWGATLGTGLLAALIDLPMERAMTNVFQYWRWMPPGPLFGAPVLNFVGWALVGSGLGLLLWLRKVRTSCLSSLDVLGTFCIFVSISSSLYGSELAYTLLFVFSLAALGYRWWTVKTAR